MIAIGDNQLTTSLTIKNHDAKTKYRFYADITLLKMVCINIKGRKWQFPKWLIWLQHVNESCNACDRWTNPLQASGMVVMDISQLTGYSAVNIDELQTHAGSKLKRIDSDDNKIVLYFDEVMETCHLQSAAVSYGSCTCLHINNCFHEN